MARPANDALVVPSGTAIYIGVPAPAPATPALTFALPDTLVVNVAGAGSIFNSSTAPSAAWSLPVLTYQTITPSSGGAIAAGATVSLSVVATVAASYSNVLTCVGATITGNPQGIVVSATATPSITLSAVSATGVVGTNGTATVTNNGPGSAVWTLTPSAGMTATPSTGTLASGASLAPVLAYTTTGAKTLTLANGSGGTVTGSPASITVSAANATTATLVLSTTGTTGSPTTGSVSLNGVAPSAGSVSIPGAGATITPATLSWAAGEAGTAKSFTVNRAADGTTSVSITNTMGLANAGTPVSHMQKLPRRLDIH